MKLKQQGILTQQGSLMLLCKKITGLLLLMTLLIPTIAHSAVNTLPPLIINDDVGLYPLGLKIELLEDLHSKLTIEDILSPNQAKRFKPSTVEVPSFGFTDTTYWAKLTIVSQSTFSKEWFLEIAYPLLDEVDVYVLVPNNASAPPEKIFRTGDLLPFASRPFEHANFVFPLTLIAHQPITLITRVKSKGAVQFPMTLYSAQKFIEHNNKQTLGFGLYLGIMLVMLLYNFFIYLSVKDPSYFYYVAYILFFTLMALVLNGLAYQYLWPNFIWWANHGLYFFIGGFNLLALLFSRSFLQTKITSPRLEKAFVMLQALSVLSMISPLILEPKTLMTVLVPATMASIVLVIIAAIHCIKRGYRPAKFFLLAWAGLLVGCILRVMLGIGLVPSNFITEYSVLTGSALEVILLSLALQIALICCKNKPETMTYWPENTPKRPKEMLNRRSKMPRWPSKMPKRPIRPNASLLPMFLMKFARR